LRKTLKIVKYKLHDNWSFGFRDVPLGKTETIAASTHILKFCERVFMVISIPIIHKSFNYSNIQFDLLYVEFFNSTTNEI